MQFVRAIIVMLFTVSSISALAADSINECVDLSGTYSGISRSWSKSTGTWRNDANIVLKIQQKDCSEITISSYFNGASSPDSVTVNKQNLVLNKSLTDEYQSTLFFANEVLQITHIQLTSLPSFQRIARYSKSSDGKLKFESSTINDTGISVRQLFEGTPVKGQ
jgi:hypothetical protein